MKRHCHNAYLCYIRNKREKGLYLVIYDSINEALCNFKHIYSYFYNDIDIRHIAKVIEVGCDDGECDIYKVYQAYDPDYQCMILIKVDDKNYFEVVNYTREEGDDWLKHTDCGESVSMT
jgi:hypothetical protein